MHTVTHKYPTGVPQHRSAHTKQDKTLTALGMIRWQHKYPVCQHVSWRNKRMKGEKNGSMRKEGSLIPWGTTDSRHLDSCWEGLHRACQLVRVCKKVMYWTTRTIEPCETLGRCDVEVRSGSITTHSAEVMLTEEVFLPWVVGAVLGINVELFTLLKEKKKHHKNKLIKRVM